MAERIIIFVEGETEEVLFPRIIDVYKKRESRVQEIQMRHNQYQRNWQLQKYS